MRLIGIIIGILSVVLLPNLIWLATSTVRINNESGFSIENVGYIACEQKFDLGSFRDGEATFRFLPACGDDTLIITVRGSEFCQTYMEGELYHVDATIQKPDKVQCKYDDLLSSLFLAKLLW
jgi:hypothetical protein